MGQFHSVFNTFLSLSKSSSLRVHSLLFGANELPKQPRAGVLIVTPPKPPLQSLPAEFLLKIFSQLELKPYTISHGVCKDWRRLLPLADIHSIRCRIFELYQNMINTPNLLNTRPWIVENLQPFDRQAHVDALLAQHPAIPEQYQVWILEWPARAVIACMWPGLPFVSCYDDPPKRRFGVNWLGYKRESPELMAPIYKHRTPEVRFIPALLIWRDPFLTDWLSFDTVELSLIGRVYISDFMEGDGPEMIPNRRPLSEDGDDFSQDTPRQQVLLQEYDPYADIALRGYHPDWINYLEDQWAFNVRNILNPGDPFPKDDLLIPEQQVITRFNEDALPATRPTCPWNVRQFHTAYLDFS